MADSAQRFLKICLPVFLQELYSKGETLAFESVPSGVSRLSKLFVGPRIKETFAKILPLFKLTKINNIPFKFVSDLISFRDKWPTNSYSGISVLSYYCANCERC